MTIRLTVLGGALTFGLVEHPMTVEPQSVAQQVGYVRFPGSDTLKVAQWRNGGWLDHRAQAFPEAPECWYSAELVERG